MAKRKNARSERVTGLYSAIPHNVINCARYMATSHLARALLIEVAMDHNGNNNGRLRVHQKGLVERGWCVASILRARDELVHYGLLIQTRHGGLNNGSHLYAASWLPITNYVGLEIGPHEYHPGTYLLPLPSKPFEVPKKVKRGDPEVESQEKKPCLPRRQANGSATLPRRQGEAPPLSAAQSERPCFKGSALSAAQIHIKKTIGTWNIAQTFKPTPAHMTASRLH
jgi:hypothetical protein